MTVSDDGGEGADRAGVGGAEDAGGAEVEAGLAERMRALEERLRQLEERDRRKSKVVADVAHELRAPLSSLTLYLDLVERGKPEKRDDYMAIVREQVARLGTLIEDILDLARIESGQAAASFGRVDLNDLVAGQVAAQRPQADGAGLLLRLEPAADLPAVLGLRGELEQVVANLLANAIRYTPAGEVCVSTFERRDLVCLQVKDTGPGIAADSFVYLFDRFYRGREAEESAIPGSGLGLAIVKEVVDHHGGRIELASQRGQGATFRVLLPRAPEG
jgi:signal transduction histidine kinase